MSFIHFSLIAKQFECTFIENLRKLYSISLHETHNHPYVFSDSVTLHWHGQHQRGTPYMDGIGYVSQCPIASGQSFTYQFKVSNSTVQ